MSSSTSGARRVFHRHDQPSAAQQQRQRRQPAGHREGQPRQRLGLGRELRHVDQRVAHLARQRGLQVGARHQAAAHQQLAQRHAAVLALLRQRHFELRVVDEAQRDQRLADAHHRHARLLDDGQLQVLGADDLLGQQDVAELLRAQLLLLVQRLLDLRRRGRVLRHQHLADALADLHRVIGRQRHEAAQHAAARVHRREQEDAGGVLEVADAQGVDRGRALQVDLARPPPGAAP